MSFPLSLLGAPLLRTGGTQQALQCERRAQLLVYLALRRTWVSRGEAAALLWPEHGSKLALTNLRKALHRLQALADDALVEVQGNALRCEALTDVLAFEEHLQAQRLGDALALWNGEPLQGFDDPANEAWTSWLGFERQRLRALWRAAAQQQLATEIDPAPAVALATALLAAEPFDEDALALLVRWLVRAGQPGRARQVHHEFVVKLERELNLPPSAAVSALAGELEAPHRPGQSARAAQATAGSSADDAFVGRIVELRRVEALLAQQDCRLLTLVGPGGVGKTRLAQRVLAEGSARFADGTRFIALDDLASAALLGQRLARDLQVELSGRTDALTQVASALRSRAMLLVLDNFEQVSSDARVLEPLLAACPRLKLIVTSRVRLGLAAEWLLQLDGLPCPEAEDRDEIEQFDAAQLFIRAARRMRPDLVPAAEAEAIIAICAHLEGLPLALELAASWTRVLSCTAIAEQLGRGLDLLHTPDPAQPPRHASLEVVFEQSWRLLGALEQNALARLSVFAGSFTADAASVVAGAPLAVLAALADKSLLRRDTARLRLHPLVQQFAAARLQQSGAEAAAARAHAEYFDRLRRQLSERARGGDGVALKALDAEFEDCQRAWAWAVQHAQSRALLSAAAALVDYCENRARFVEGLAMLEHALAADWTSGDARLEATLRAYAAKLLSRLGRYTESEQYAQRALALAEATGDAAARFVAITTLGGCATFTGKFVEAARLYEQGLDIARALGRPDDMAATLDNRALAVKRLGDYDRALQLNYEALALHRRNRDLARAAVCLCNLGSFQLFLNDDAAGEGHLREALALSEQHGLVSTRAYALANLTELALKRRDANAGWEHARKALEVSEASGMRSLAGWLNCQLARMAAWRGDMPAAHQWLAAGATAAIELSLPAVKAAAALAFAELLEAEGRAGTARTVLRIAKDEPSLSAPDREELHAAWQLRIGDEGNDAAAAAVAAAPHVAATATAELSLDAIMTRLAIEAHVLHAPLSAVL